MNLEDALAANAEAITRLTKPQLRMLLPVLRKAQRDVARIVRGYARTDNGTEAQRQRAALLQLNTVIKTLEKKAGRALGKDVVAQLGATQSGAIRGLRAMVEAGASKHGRVQPLRLDIAAIVADGKRALIGRVGQTASSFGARLSRDIRRDIVDGIIRGDSIDAIAAKVARKTLPSTRDGIPRAARDVRHGMETTIDPRKFVGRHFQFQFETEGRGPFGQGEEKAKRGLEVMSRGQQRDPVVIAVSPGGNYHVSDGRHRLLAAYQLGVPVRVKWERGHPSMDGPEGIALEQKQIRELSKQPFERARKQAEGIVRTELAHAYNAVQLDALRALDEEDEGWLKVWDSANDVKVCPICRGLDNEVRAVDENFSNGSEHPPAHPRCRCNVMPWRHEYGKHKFERRRDEERDRDVDVLKRDVEGRPSQKPLPSKPKPKEPPMQPVDSSTMSGDAYRALGNRVSDRELRTFAYRVVVNDAGATEETMRARQRHPKLWTREPAPGLELSKHKTREQAEASIRRLSKFGYVSRIVRVEVEK